MTHRERFMAVLDGGVPDRTPIVANLTIQAAERVAKVLGTPVEYVDAFLASRISHREMLLKLGNDAVLIAGTPAKASLKLENGDVRDELGITYRKIGLYDEAVVRPLSECESVEQLDEYKFPDPNAKEKWLFSEKTVKQYKSDYAIIGDLEVCIFELAWNLVGLEKFLMDLLTQEEYIDVLLDRIEEYSTQCGLKMIELGCDMIWAGDDFGMQSAMIISPDLWRERFKARYERMWKRFRQADPNIKIAFHSCGSIAPIIDDFIEIGLDFLNPIQPLAAGMELSELYEKYSDRIGFFGGVDVQNVLPHGSVEDVRNEVRRVIDAVKHSPRFIIAPAHNIQPDTSVENIFAFFDEAIKYGVIDPQ